MISRYPVSRARERVFLGRAGGVPLQG